MHEPQNILSFNLTGSLAMFCPVWIHIPTHSNLFVAIISRVVFLICPHFTGRCINHFLKLPKERAGRRFRGAFMCYIVMYLKLRLTHWLMTTIDAIVQYECCCMPMVVCFYQFFPCLKSSYSLFLCRPSRSSRGTGSVWPHSPQRSSHLDPRKRPPEPSHRSVYTLYTHTCTHTHSFYWTFWKRVVLH